MCPEPLHFTIKILRMKQDRPPPHEPTEVGISLLRHCGEQARKPSRWRWMHPFHSVHLLLQSCPQPGTTLPASFTSSWGYGTNSHPWNMSRMWSSKKHKEIPFLLCNLLSTGWRRLSRTFLAAKAWQSHEMDFTFPQWPCGKPFSGQEIHIQYRMKD